MEREMIHTFREGRRIERERRRASWFPHSLVLHDSRFDSIELNDSEGGGWSAALFMAGGP